MDELLHKISDNFVINGMNLYNKLSIIEFCKEEDVKIYEFTFGQELSSGLVNFGMVAISKENNVLDAISCLYTLNFEIARVLVTKKKRKRFAGINMGTSRKSWYEPKSLGFITKRAFLNFCRYKAMQEFTKRNLVTVIYDVSSLTDVQSVENYIEELEYVTRSRHKKENFLSLFHIVFLEIFLFTRTMYPNFIYVKTIFNRSTMKLVCFRNVNVMKTVKYF